MQTDSSKKPPVNTRESAMEVYRRLKRLILSGHFAVGEALSQVRLAAEFETSRGPVREAIRLLQREGLVEVETNQRGRVASFTAFDLEQLCAQLVLNVPAAIRMAAGELTASDKRRLAHVLGRIEQLADLESRFGAARLVMRRQLAFRRLVTWLCRYSGPDIVAMIDGLLDRIAMIRQMLEASGTSPPYPLARRFPRLHEAIAAGDANEIAQIMAHTIADVSSKALAYMAPAHEPKLLRSYSVAAEAINAAGSTASKRPRAEYDVTKEVTIRMTLKSGGEPVWAIIEADNPDN